MPKPKLIVKQLCKKCKKYYIKTAKFCQYYCDECREEMRGIENGKGKEKEKAYSD